MLKFGTLKNKTLSKMFNFCKFRKINSSTDIHRTLTEQNPIIYGDEISPPVRFVLMTASILNIDIDFRKIDLFKTENRSDFFKKINPLQKVPAMVTDDITICDSHAIAIYFCQLANDHSLYPEDREQKAKINQILFFNSSTLFRIDSELMSTFFAGHWPVNKMKLEEWYSALDFLEYLLKRNNWLSGNKMHLCDICIVTVVTSMCVLVPLTTRHRRVQQWVKRFETLPFFDINMRGVSVLYNHVVAMKI